MRSIHLLDTAVATDNIGDEIIRESILPRLRQNFSDAYLTDSSTHDGLGRRSRRSLATAEFAVLMGTNALSNSFLRSQVQWPVSPRDIRPLAGKVVLFGVGSQLGSTRVSQLQRRFLRTLLSPIHTHSVRDAEAKLILDQCGMKSLNTSCPTLWDWKSWPERQEQPADTACFSLTAYRPHHSDRILIQTLAARYARLAAWIQMPKDLEYLHSITDDRRIEIIAPNLEAYDEFLERQRPDVVGTRLHGTIRAMSKGCRGLVVAIDNRARGIARDTGLPTINRDDVATRLAEVLDEWPTLELSLPTDDISSFNSQFPPPQA